jgi:hypothetical protein
MFFCAASERICDDYATDAMLERLYYETGVPISVSPEERADRRYAILLELLDQVVLMRVARHIDTHNVYSHDHIGRRSSMRVKGIEEDVGCQKGSEFLHGWTSPSPEPLDGSAISRAKSRAELAAITLCRVEKSAYAVQPALFNICVVISRERGSGPTIREHRYRRSFGQEEG